MKRFKNNISPDSNNLYSHFEASQFNTYVLLSKNKISSNNHRFSKTKIWEKKVR